MYWIYYKNPKTGPVYYNHNRIIYTYIYRLKTIYKAYLTKAYIKTLFTSQLIYQIDNEGIV